MGSKIDRTAETLRRWVWRAERDQDKWLGATTEEPDRIRQLENENRELRQANEILGKGVGVFCPSGDRPSVQTMTVFVDEHRAV